MADEIFNNDNNEQNSNQGNEYSNEYTSNPYDYNNASTAETTETDAYTYAYEQVTQQNDDSNAKTLAIVSLVLGILAILMGCCVAFIGIVLGIPGIICGAISLKKKKNGMAIAGIICSIIGIVLGILNIVLAAVLMATGGFLELMQ